MLLPWTNPTRNVASWVGMASLLLCLDIGSCMTGGQRLALRNEAQDLFYHGYNNYLQHAFPEDELRPLSCSPLTRDRDNPAHIEVNDVLGNYSLTLVDSLSTLAILASSSSSAAAAHAAKGENINLRAFQDGVQKIVELYGDGSDGLTGRGTRERGFDLDSKVQVFETVIRGVGGLLSAHLFAVGELPIRGYHPKSGSDNKEGIWGNGLFKRPKSGIQWSNGLVYDGQLLRLAADLGTRLLPAFYTPTGIPYPRVNLRSGVPFYPGSILVDSESGTCDADQEPNEEITETCSAGAGSLVLEFSVLSRLTGDDRFEKLAKRAFWAIWNRRSAIGLIGSGINAENGEWVGSYTGVGAGIDSFFEYAFKTHVLLSNDYRAAVPKGEKDKGFGKLNLELTAAEDSPDGFLKVWTEAHAAIKRHIYRGRAYQHPHYIQGDLFSGATRAFWIDSLSAFYPGLLTIAGEIDEAIETQLLLTALWARYSALPERWNLGTGEVEGGLGWWNGRPELIESNYHLYRATRDPWYLHVGEMALCDIKRRCWTPCGWAGIQDVRTGQLSDRMESYFLSETAKYLFLLFDEDHPLNHLDGPLVFSTEGHPLILPSNVKHLGKKVRPIRSSKDASAPPLTCPKSPEPPPLGLSYTAARDDVFHAASLARLPFMPVREPTGSLRGGHGQDHPSISQADMQSPSNYTYYPWTLPASLVAHNATSAPLSTRPTFDISFPPIQDLGALAVPLQRVKQGILINHIGGVRMGMIQDAPVFLPDRVAEGYRVHTINNLALGKDEKVFLAGDAISSTLNPTDPNFTRIRDPEMFDLVLDLTIPDSANETQPAKGSPDQEPDSTPSTVRSTLNSLVAQLNAFLNDPREHALSLSKAGPNRNRFYIPAITATGVGAAPIPDWKDAPSRTAPVNGQPQPAVSLGWKKIHATDELCSHQLSRSIAQTHQVLVIKRGGCSFSKKLANIPAFAHNDHAIQLVVLVDFEDKGGDGDEVFDEASLIRPLLDVQQKTAKGVVRRNPIPVVMVGGGERAYTLLRNAVGMGIKRRYRMESRGVRIVNLIVV